MNKKEYGVLINFLKSGLSTRQLDKLLGHNNTKGWFSWDILKKYKLTNYDKGKLFLHSINQCKNAIRQLEVKKERTVNEFIKLNQPVNLHKYKNVFIIAESEKKFYSAMSGETRNIVRDFFHSKKKSIGKCQYGGCSDNKQIDTVHLRKNRPQIFIDSAKKNKELLNEGLFKFDLYGTMKGFLITHAKRNSICFLCKNHHNEFHKNEKTGKSQLRHFMQKIII
ncbi:hypothetical protein HYS31_00455 [Candidatus Woesearchaeota archaeon]|nr:hypothetical protein [Candidatus Woesearchaeota archaeon]